MPQKTGNRLVIFFVYAIVFVVSVLPHLTHAQEFSSTNFRALDPVIHVAGYSTSSNFRLTSTLFQLAIGTSTATSFQAFSGFEYFPFVTTPAVTATAGDSQVALSWTSASSYLGWSVGGYTIGQSTTAGGSYTYSDFGNVLSSTRTGLSNSTTYYFVIRVRDVFDNFIATSSEVSGIPTASPSPPPPSPSPSPSPSSAGGGGGGGITPSSSATVNFSGRAYPRSSITLLKDGQVALKSPASADSRFSLGISNLVAGSYLFSLYTEDRRGAKSGTLSYPVTLTAGATTNISGIFFAPTIDVDKEEVVKGENISIFGQSASNATVTIAVNSEEEYFLNTPSDKDGIYLYNFDTTPLELGSHLTKSKAAVGGEISNFGSVASFLVGRSSIARKVSTCKRADLNCDNKVNLIDFSIAAFWYKRDLSSAFTTIERERLNADGKINLVDFSIMAFYWTG